MSKRDLFWGRTRLGRCLHVCERTPGWVSDEQGAWTLCWGSAAKPVSETELWADLLPSCRKCLAKLRDGEVVEWLG